MRCDGTHAHREADLSPLLTHKFRLADYRHAIEANLNAGREKLIKSAFVFY